MWRLHYFLRKRPTLAISDCYTVDHVTSCRSWSQTNLKQHQNENVLLAAENRLLQGFCWKIETMFKFLIF